MSNSQNKKNEQQNNLCTMSLTEQWEKGELEIDKNYYLRFADGTEEIQLYVGAFLMRADNEVVEVLAPVPSYEEWQDLKEQSVKNTDAYYDMIIAARNGEIEGLEKKNQQLKDVISKMCMELVDTDDDMSNGLAEHFSQDLLLEIHEVLK